MQIRPKARRKRSSETKRNSLKDLNKYELAELDLILFILPFNSKVKKISGENVYFVIYYQIIYNVLDMFYSSL